MGNPGRFGSMDSEVEYVIDIYLVFVGFLVLSGERFLSFEDSAGLSVGSCEGVLDIYVQYSNCVFVFWQ